MISTAAVHTDPRYQAGTTRPVAPPLEAAPAPSARPAPAPAPAPAPTVPAIQIEAPTVAPSTVRPHAAAARPRDLILPRSVVASWSLLVLMAIGFAFVAGLLAGHYVWRVH